MMIQMYLGQIEGIILPDFAWFLDHRCGKSKRLVSLPSPLPNSSIQDPAKSLGGCHLRNDSHLFYRIISLTHLGETIMPEPRKLRVFLCHSSNDKPAVRELYQRFKAEGWIDPWLDEEKLYPGQDWDLEIEKAVEVSVLKLSPV